ncbi:hypothetical protein VOI54_15700 [Tamlana sp. 2201CG12-4]|uniref:glycosyl hydrolase family 95 catalytic domain-containing protein n=1 Tax=Tamlana sp. 2201CG12-4 TaxID=3112582 RepID=UPI002DB76041|nr:hypothetical protein [Tamlana sp. 2201CG12-4]MEC3908474.1 hypothetical protein [Tamlana sp. 2201CG12-4]
MNKTLTGCFLLILVSCINKIKEVKEEKDIFAMDVYEENRSPVQGISAVFSKPPARIPVPYSVDAPMLGNGFTGEALSGNPESQTYYLARNDFWRLKSSFNQSFPAVLGKIIIDIPELKGASYLVEQNLYDAKTYSSFSKAKQKVRLKTYVSAIEDLMVVEVSLSGKGELVGNVHLDLPDSHELINNPPLDLIFPATTKQGMTDEGISYISRGFEEDVDIPSKAACALSILGSNTNSFKLKEGKPVFIVVTFSSNFKSDDCLKAVVKRAGAINNRDLLAVEARHETWWKDFWSKSYIDIGESVIEKQYYLSNYSMGSLSRDKDFPPAIFGTCITQERPHWNGDYHLNYNHFAPFYGLFSSNHIEQAVPSNMPILAQQERGEYYAKTICGIEDGILLPVGAGPLGIETTRKNELMTKQRSNWIEEGNVEDEGLFFGQKSNSSYSIVNMAQHFYSTYDKEYTKIYYPFVKGVAIFWEGYLTWEGNRYVIYKDAIHEGSVGDKNPILSLGLVRLVMQTAIDMSKDLGVDQDRNNRWQHILDNLSNYTYQEHDGKSVFRYTEKGMAWAEGNTLGIQHIYPAGQIHLDSDPELLKVAYNTIEAMQRWIDNNGSNSFFPAAVRVGYEPNIILQELRRYSQNTYSNGFQLENPHGIENFSTVPNTINEMLCMGHAGVLRVFPVWPKDKDARFYNLRTFGAFLVSSELSDSQVTYVKITSEKGKTLKFKNPWAGKDVEVKSNMSKTRKMKGDMLEIDTKLGEKLRLKKML